MSNVIISPIITEKAMKASKSGRYSFLVAKDASKSAIKQAVGEMFKVNVIGVKTTITKGRKIRTGVRRIEVSKSDIKKAIVVLKKGQTIGLFEPGGGEPEAEVKEEKKKKTK